MFLQGPSPANLGWLLITRKWLTPYPVINSKRQGQLVGARLTRFFVRGPKTSPGVLEIGVAVF